MAWPYMTHELVCFSFRVTTPKQSTSEHEALQRTVRRVHRLRRRQVAARLEAGRPQHHDFVAVVDEGARWRVDEALAAAWSKDGLYVSRVIDGIRITGCLNTPGSH